MGKRKRKRGGRRGREGGRRGREEGKKRKRGGEKRKRGGEKREKKNTPKGGVEGGIFPPRAPLATLGEVPQGLQPRLRAE